MFWRKRKKSPAELANEAEIEKLAHEATVGELEVAFGDLPPSESGHLKLADDKPYDGDAEQTSP